MTRRAFPSHPHIVVVATVVGPLVSYLILLREQQHVYCDNQSIGSWLVPLVTRLIQPFQNVEFLNNPARFLDPYHFRVTFECIAALKEGALHRIDHKTS